MTVRGAQANSDLPCGGRTARENATTEKRTLGSEHGEAPHLGCHRFGRWVLTTNGRDQRAYPAPHRSNPSTMARSHVHHDRRSPLLHGNG